MKIDLKDMVGGALQQKFQNSFDRVMENLQDVNTPYKDKREITITMKFVQNEARDNVLCDIAVKEKLAMQGGLTTQFAMGKDLTTGEIVAEEYGKQLKGQLSMDDTKAAENMAKVDLETGEAMEDVIDIRRAK